MASSQEFAIADVKVATQSPHSFRDARDEILAFIEKGALFWKVHAECEWEKVVVVLVSQSNLPQPTRFCNVVLRRKRETPWSLDYTNFSSVDTVRPEGFLDGDILSISYEDTLGFCKNYFVDTVEHNFAVASIVTLQDGLLRVNTTNPSASIFVAVGLKSRLCAVTLPGMEVPQCRPLNIEFPLVYRRADDAALEPPSAHLVLDVGAEWINTTDVTVILAAVNKIVWPNSHRPGFNRVIVKRGETRVFLQRAANARDPATMELNTHWMFFSQLIYQYSQMLFFALIRQPERKTKYAEYPPGVGWLVRAICSAGALHVLDALATLWEQDAPYPNWKPYATSLREYGRGLRPSMPPTWWPIQGIPPNESDAAAWAATLLVPVFSDGKAVSSLHFLEPGAGDEAPVTSDALLHSWLERCVPAVKSQVERFRAALGGPSNTTAAQSFTAPPESAVIAGFNTQKWTDIHTKLFELRQMLELEESIWLASEGSTYSAIKQYIGGLQELESLVKENRFYAALQFSTALRSVNLRRCFRAPRNSATEMKAARKMARRQAGEAFKGVCKALNTIFVDHSYFLLREETARRGFTDVAAAKLTIEEECEVDITLADKDPISDDD